MSTPKRPVILFAATLALTAVIATSIQTMHSQGRAIPVLDGLSPAEAAARNQFSDQMGALEEQGDYGAMITQAKAWQKSHPDDPNGYASEGLASYYMGDLDTCICDWDLAGRMDSGAAAGAQEWIKTAQLIQQRHPGVKLAPLVRADSDGETAIDRQKQRAHALLAAGKDAEIEAEAARMTQHPAVLPRGAWELSSFYRGLWEMPDDATDAQWQKNHQLLEAWRWRRPNSLLAQISVARSWVEGAWVARGHESAAKVSSKQFQIMDARLAAAGKILHAVYPQARKNPLFYVAWIRWAQLASSTPEESQAMVKEALAVYPTLWELPIYQTILLAPRWGGRQGEWEQVTAANADAVGGTEGDILYARTIWWQHDMYHFDNIWKTTAASWPRTKRGFAALLKRYPNSLDVATRYSYFAQMANDAPLARELEEKYLHGRVTRDFWSTPKPFAQNRMWVYRQP
jgi:hypothetical protein